LKKYSSHGHHHASRGHVATVRPFADAQLPRIPASRWCSILQPAPVFLARCALEPMVPQRGRKERVWQRTVRISRGKTDALTQSAESSTGTLEGAAHFSAGCMHSAGLCRRGVPKGVKPSAKTHGLVIPLGKPPSPIHWSACAGSARATSRRWMAYWTRAFHCQCAAASHCQSEGRWGQCRIRAALHAVAVVLFLRQVGMGDLDSLDGVHTIVCSNCCQK